MALADKVTVISLFLQRDLHWHRQRKIDSSAIVCALLPGGVTDEALPPPPKIKSIRLTEV